MTEERGSLVLRTIAPALANPIDRRGVMGMTRNRDRFIKQLPDLTWVWTRAGLSWDAESLLSFSLEGGRREPGAEFSPWVLRASFTETIPNMRAELRIGDVLEVGSAPGIEYYLESTGWTAPPDGFTWPDLFVTDLELEYQTAHLEDDEPGTRGPVPIYTVTATSKLARLGQIMYGDEPRPAEPAGYRLFQLGQWVLDTIGAPTNNTFFWQIDLVDGEPQLRPRDVDRQPMAQVMRQTAADAGGYLYESQRGQLVYEPLDGRRNRSPIVQLDAADLEAAARWNVSLGGTVNRLTLTSGLEGARVESTVADDDSVAQYGDYSAGRETDLLDQAEAERLARLIVGRNSRPRWTLEALDFELLRGLPPEKAGPLFYGDIGQLIELVGLPSTAPTPRFYYIEGKRIEQTKHELRCVVYVTEAGRSGAPVRWVDVGGTWADAALDDHGDDLTWLGAAAWFAPPPTGPARWADVPADQAWWHVSLDYFGNPEVRDHGDARVPTWASYPDDPA